MNGWFHRTPTGVAGNDNYLVKHCFKFSRHDALFADKTLHIVFGSLYLPTVLQYSLNACVTQIMFDGIVPLQYYKVYIRDNRLNTDKTIHFVLCFLDCCTRTL